jgi:hypothetical protein
VEFQDNGNRVGVTRHVNEIFKLIDIHFYILLALKVVVQFEAHECRHCLILWAKGGHEFRGKISPVSEGHDSSPHFLSYYMFGEHHCMSGLEEKKCPVYACLFIWVVQSCERPVKLAGGEEGAAL